MASSMRRGKVTSSGCPSGFNLKKPGMIMENKNKNENQFAGDSAPEIDEAARRLNEQILWENAVNGSYKEEEDANQDEPSGGQ